MAYKPHYDHQLTLPFHGSSEEETPKGAFAPSWRTGTIKKKKKLASYSVDEKLGDLKHLDEFDDIEPTINAFYPDLPAHKYNSRQTHILSCAESARQFKSCTISLVEPTNERRRTKVKVPSCPTLKNSDS
ncbi:hypothetical protein PF003_g13485 [Phytophthora fragariae]|nr:hypothetical protein PF003_g13485 [Phytophthora fragariae]